MDLLRFLAVHPALYGNLQQPVLEVGSDVVSAYALWQFDPPPEVPIVTLPGIRLGCRGLSRARTLNGKRALGERDLHLFLGHARKLTAYLQVFTVREDVRRGDPGGRMGLAELTENTPCPERFSASPSGRSARIAEG